MKCEVSRAPDSNHGKNGEGELFVVLYEHGPADALVFRLSEVMRGVYKNAFRLDENVHEKHAKR